MSSEKKLYVILVFALVVQGAVSALMWRGPDELAAIASASGVVVLETSLIAFSAHQLALSRTDWTRIVGTRPSARLVSFAAAIGLLLFAFTLGEHAVEVLAVSSFDSALPQRIWHFHEAARPIPNLFDSHVLAHAFTMVISAPIAEELFFRGLLFPAISQRTSLAKACLISSVIFTALHLNGAHFLSCMVFAVSQCMLYAAGRSIVLCIVVHMTYNLLVFVMENYNDIQLTKAFDTIGQVSTWQPQLIMFALSFATLAVLVKRYKRLV